VCVCVFACVRVCFGSTCAVQCTVWQSEVRLVYNPVLLPAVCVIFAAAEALKKTAEPLLAVLAADAAVDAATTARYQEAAAPVPPPGPRPGRSRRGPQ
jgi:hypothetical protein